LFCQNGKKITADFENGEQKGFKAKCLGKDKLSLNKG
jgi:hypothetical protein